MLYIALLALLITSGNSAPPESSGSESEPSSPPASPTQRSTEWVFETQPFVADSETSGDEAASTGTPDYGKHPIIHHTYTKSLLK